jgi:hypothetical protein
MEHYATIHPLPPSLLRGGAVTPAFTGTAIAMQAGDELWLGSFNADRLAYRSLKP